MRIFSICLTVLAVVCAVVAAFGFTVLAMAKDGAAYDGGEFQDSFISASELHSERKAVARLRQACDESEGRLTYSCFCENAAGSQLQFDEAVAAAENGKRVYVAVRLLDGNSFGPEEINVATVWHQVVLVDNLKLLLEDARTFQDVGDRRPER
ncbi:MAG: hypothetical protein KDB68_03505 [Planctomycetes bacterium]|nr:hypothetical protein [Planctomycetota bacterium]MCA8935248.1 hypothetical protein [Planctomycetota bacterium]